MMVARPAASSTAAFALVCAAGCGGPVGSRVDVPPAPVGELAMPLAAHLCWIDAVEPEGTGLSVRFRKDAPVPSGGEVVHLEPGASLAPANSGHDGCTITAVRRHGVSGVEAEAQFFDAATMSQPQVRREWIAAATGR